MSRKFELSRQITIPQGFQFSANAAGIKLSGKPDLALAWAPEGATAAAMFTSNRVVAAPVTVGREHLRSSQGRLRAVVVNAGNANCATGKQGLRAAQRVCEQVGKRLECPAREVFPSSTGVIGVQLPVERITGALPTLLKEQSAELTAFRSFAQAIMTTDRRMKVACGQLQSGRRRITLLGCAKGAGMIHPRLATMLVYLFTDVMAGSAELQRLLRPACAASFNRISVDGDTSTNDTVLLMASGASGVKLESKIFAPMLNAVCRCLARQIVADGEGVQHVVELEVSGARSEAEAEQVARAIANSPLVKTAWAGSDPNWGRVLCAAGYSGAAIRPERVDIFFGPHQVCRKGEVARFDESEVHQYLKQPTIKVRVSLGLGKRKATFWTCDLTHEYISVNADYRT